VAGKGKIRVVLGPIAGRYGTDLCLPLRHLVNTPSGSSLGGHVSPAS